jgi:hypothetical protein
MLEVHDDDLEWDVDRFQVKGNPERFKTMTELAWAAYHEVPPGMEPGLEAINYYDPPNFTFRSAPTSAWSTSTSTPARPRCGASTRSTIAARASTR